jgi:predicted metalloprotease with PDZ domain
MKTEDKFQVVDAVVPESPAAVAGFDKGDMIVAINGESLMGKTLQAALAKVKPDSVVKIAFFRDGKLMEKSVKLSASFIYDVSKKSNANARQKAVAESWLKVKWEEF